ncbi:hydrogenase maturation protease [Streptomyces sp. LX-29]|nr:hydrogenase maturation protease [Streptomyces sp. LX-29]WFB11462.1 hydrogenase maturation protease [Streptomyces sp. LX-29]
MSGDRPAAPPARILVAGIGNVFLADDGFGCEVAQALGRRPLPEGVRVADFGIRGMDLAYRMLEGWDTVVFVDAAPRGAAPGTLFVIEPDLREIADAAPETHAMDPVRVLALARHLSEGPLPRVLVVGCEPEVRMTGEEPDVQVGLSEPVRRAVDEAVPLVEKLLADLLDRTGEEVRSQ